MSRTRRSILLGALAGGLPGWLRAGEAPPLQFGLMPYLSTRTLIATYQPLAKGLETTLGQPVQLLTAPDFPAFVQRIALGEYDLLLLAPHFAQLAMRDYAYLPILSHSAPIRGFLVVDREQPLRQLSELKNQRIAVVDRSAALAIAGVNALAGAGLLEERDYRLLESTTHSSALHSMLSGEARAAIISAASLQLAPAEVQREIAVARELVRLPGQYYLAHNRLTTQRLASIKAALRSFEASAAGRAFFEKTGHGGFREPDAEDSALLDRLLPETRRQLGLPTPGRR